MRWRGENIPVGSSVEFLPTKTPSAKTNYRSMVTVVRHCFAAPADLTPNKMFIFSSFCYVFRFDLSSFGTLLLFLLLRWPLFVSLVLFFCFHDVLVEVYLFSLFRIWGIIFSCNRVAPNLFCSTFLCSNQFSQCNTVYAAVSSSL